MPFLFTSLSFYLPSASIHQGLLFTHSATSFSNWQNHIPIMYLAVIARCVYIYQKVLKNSWKIVFHSTYFLRIFTKLRSYNFLYFIFTTTEYIFIFYIQHTTDIMPRFSLLIFWKYQRILKLNTNKIRGISVSQFKLHLILLCTFYLLWRFIHKPLSWNSRNNSIPHKYLHS